ncbi:MAG: hypothetical protein DDG60_14975 [Anaerolineae bacterium]|nr:MAG: hypothetical protein DDG60_14975 [Anaerolineae bacterium]
MLDFQKILVRAWQILWNYRALWVFGFILALASGGGGGGGNNYSARENSNQFFSGEGLEQFQGKTPGELFNAMVQMLGQALRHLQERFPVEFQMGIAAIVFAFLVFSLFGLALTILRYVAEAATIRMVDEYEQSGLKVGFWQGWRYGWSRAAWRLFLLDVLVHLPLLVMFTVIGLVIWWILSAALSGVRASLATALIAGIGLVFVTAVVIIVLVTVLRLVRDLAWRSIVLENLTVLDAFRQALTLGKRQWKNVGLMWLMMIGIGIVWTLLFFIIVFPLLAVSILTGLLGLLTALIPGLLTAGVAALFSVPDYWPWIFAAIIGLPIFIVIWLAPIFLVDGWAKIYASSVWTLTYRELKALEALKSDLTQG